MKRLVLLALTTACMVLCASCSRNVAQDGPRVVDGCATVMEYDWMIGPFTKRLDVNPCLGPDSTFVFHDPIRDAEVSWHSLNAYNPAAIVKDGKVYLLFRAEDHLGKYHGTSRVGLAVSEDGYHFTTYPEPVVFPDKDEYEGIEWEGGCEDPRIVESREGTYYLYYTAYNGNSVLLSCAESKDLVNWTKRGPIFAKALDGKYSTIWSKSGAVVCQQEGEHFYPVKIKGKYWMYWGESNIYAATSDDLVNWTPVEFVCECPAIPNKKISIVDFDGTIPQFKETRTLFPVVAPRCPGFDELLCEPGPQALLTEKGIILIYNGFGPDEQNDGRVYAGEQLLLDRNDPTQVLVRTTLPFITPSEPYDFWRFSKNTKSGNVFLENLVYFNGKYMMYYGAGDHEVAIAETAETDIII